MATPEQERPLGFRPPEGVTPTVEQVDAQKAQELGVSPTPAHPQSVVNDNNQVVAQSSDPYASDQPAAVIETVEVPISQDQAMTYRKGSINDSSTWLGASVLRTIKKALHFGKRVVLGSKSA